MFVKFKVKASLTQFKKKTLLWVLAHAGFQRSIFEAGLPIGESFDVIERKSASP